jgi:hypothetical protein
MMLEDFAIRFASQSEDRFQAIVYGCIALGAVLAALATRSKAELARAPFFSYSALVGFCMVAINIIWLSPDAAVTGGYLSLFVATSIGSWIVAGFFHCRFAMARSRDAFGHAGGAILAFIPILNLWLMLKPSMKEMSVNRAPTIPIVSGGIGVLTGFVLVAATMGVSFYIEEQARIKEEQRQVDATSAEVAPSDASLEFVKRSVRSNGVEETLRLMAAEAQTPITVDEATTLTSIEAINDQLQRTYIVDSAGVTITDQFRQRIRKNICAWPVFYPILQAGGSIKEVYVEKTGREIGFVTITGEECGY